MALCAFWDKKNVLLLAKFFCIGKSLPANPTPQVFKTHEKSKINIDKSKRLAVNARSVGFSSTCFVVILVLILARPYSSVRPSCNIVAIFCNSSRGSCGAILADKPEIPAKLCSTLRPNLSAPIFACSSLPQLPSSLLLLKSVQCFPLFFLCANPSVSQVRVNVSLTKNRRIGLISKVWFSVCFYLIWFDLIYDL